MTGWSAFVVHGAMQVRNAEKEKATRPRERNDGSTELGPAGFGPTLSQLGMNAGSIQAWLLLDKWAEEKEAQWTLALDPKPNKNTKNKIKIKMKITR